MKSVAQTVIEADRFYTIAAHTGNVIQAVEGSRDGGTVRLGKYDHKPEQEWSFVREGDGVYRIRNRASGKLLDLTMTGTANGTWLHLWEDVGGTSQMWKVEHTPEGTVRLRSSWAGGKCVDTVGIGAEVEMCIRDRSSTSRLLPGLCLASILMNSMPITMSRLRSRKVRISASLPSNSRPGIQRMRGTTLSSRPISTSPDNSTSSRLEA